MASTANIAGPVVGVTILTIMDIEYVLMIDVLGAMLDVWFSISGVVIAILGVGLWFYPIN